MISLVKSQITKINHHHQNIFTYQKFFYIRGAYRCNVGRGTYQKCKYLIYSNERYGQNLWRVKCGNKMIINLIYAKG